MKFARNEDGTIAILFAIAAIPVVLITGLAVDYATWTSAQRKMQGVGDAAALAGAKILSQSGATSSAAQSSALSMVQAMNTGSISGFTPTVSVDMTQKSVQVDLTRPGERTFSAIALSTDPVISTTSRANANGTSTPAGNGAGLCVLALDPTMKGALLASGGGLVWAKNCWVQVNSNSTKAVNFSGNSKLTSGKNCFVGGVDQGVGLMTPTPQSPCPAMADPFAGYAKPLVGACDHTNFKVSGGSPTLQPGVYCGGLTLSSVTKATLQPGLYVIKDGLFTMSGGGILEGDRITLFLTGTDAGLNWSGGGGYDLVAPAKGQAGIPGFVVFLDPAAAANSKTVISGTGQMYYEGILYFPTQQVEISGTGLTEAQASPYTIYVAKNFLYSGGSQMVVNADPTKTSVYIPTVVAPGSASAGTLLSN